MAIYLQTTLHCLICILRKGLQFSKLSRVCLLADVLISHFNRGDIESNFIVPVIQGQHENTLIKSFGMVMSIHQILWASFIIP